MNKKILIVDDEQEYIIAIRDFFREFDYAVAVTMFPKHALEIIAGEKPAIVLFDFKLPDMNGDRFLERAKALSPDTAYILITAYKDEVVLDKIRKMGVTDIVMKPINLAQLLETVQTLLKTQQKPS
ncbi:MAG: response regulator [Omnitrophica bacterium]|nr:response regulator [Candidatus Omnitrophota bacterium]